MAAGNAKIGALHVSLGLDSAQFEAGLKKAQAGLGNLGKVAATSFKVVAAGAALAGAALGVAVKGAIDYADAIDEASQKTGVAAEALSRLGYVAKIEGIGLDGLTTGLTKLSKGMLEVANGSKGPAATAFAALGVSVKDASGNLRGADEVFIDLADRFSRMEEGATKTALAMTIFGKSGAELLPTLNYGADGLRRMAAESDQLGQTISGKTAAAAGEFNDTLTKIGLVMQGVANKAMEAALPALQGLAETLSSPEFASAATTLATNIITALDGVTQVITGIINGIKAIGEWMEGPGAELPAGGFRVAYPDAYGKAEGSLDKSLAGIMMNGMPGYDYYGGLAGPNGMLNVQKPGGGTSPFVANLEAMASAGAKAKEAIDPLQARVSELSDVLAATHDPFEQMRLDLVDLKTIWDENRISAETYQRAVSRVALNTASETLGMVGELTSAFGSLFEDNKAFAVATAVINTAEGITKALAQGGVFGFASAAAIGVAGAAQVATILSAKPGSASSASVPSAAPAEAVSQQASGPSVYVKVEGQRFDRSHFEDLIKGINDAVGDGVKLRIA